MVGLSPDVSEVYLLHFRSPFFEEHESIRELVRTEWRGSCFRTQSLKKDYRRLANIPPGETFCLKRSCVSCRTIMLSRAYRYMERIKADFVVTGEMVGRNGLGETEMEGILENLGIAGYVLRPLSARRLAATHPEREGWIPRMSLGNLRADEPEKLITLAATLGLPTDLSLIHI